jgi:hypothetical protein
MRWEYPRSARPILFALLISLSGIGRLSAQVGQPQQQVLDPAKPEAVATSFRQVLSKYGSFVQHRSYGEVWVPTATPAGWHPYPPCQWARTKEFGWYYNDKSEWGAIVHHYGRWANDAQMGWVWAPGSAFSPGWVAWRTSDAYVGWAPLPPTQNFQDVSANQFNTADDWIFMDRKDFATNCDAGAAASVAQVPAILKSTSYVTQIDYVDGILIPVLPASIDGPLIDAHVGFNPWPQLFMAQTLIDLNWLWHYTLVFNVPQVCNAQNPQGGQQ